MPAAANGLARITIRAPHRRIDLAVPHQVPLVELLPEVVVRAGEAGTAGGWVLRRVDGALLGLDAALAQHGVRDGDVLYLVPEALEWPEPVYDDVMEEIAAYARADGARPWSRTDTRLTALAAIAVGLAGGLAVLVATPGRALSGAVAVTAAVILLVAGGLSARVLGDRAVGTIGGSAAMGYATASAPLLLAGARPGTVTLLAGSVALLVASVVGGLVVGAGRPIFVAGGTAATVGAGAGLAAMAGGSTAAAAIAVVIAVAGISAGPTLAVRAGRLPLPAVSADPEVIAAESRPDPARLRASVVRGDQVLAGCLAGLAAAGLVGVGLLAVAGGGAGRALAGLASAALLLRARLFPSVAVRWPLLLAGALGLAFTGWRLVPGGTAVARTVVAALVVAAVVALLSTAADGRSVSTAADGRSPASVVGPGYRPASPYLARVLDLADIIVVVALAPVALAVLGLYGWARGLAG